MIRFEAKQDGTGGVEIDVTESGATLSELAAVAMAARDMVKARMKEILREEQDGELN